MVRLGMVGIAGIVALLAVTSCSSSDGSDAAEPSLEEQGASAMASVLSEGAEPVDTDQPHPCDRVTVAEMRDLIGSKVSVTRTPESGTSAVMTCSFTPSSLEAASVTLSTAVDGGSLRDFATVMATTGGRSTSVQVPGTDEAILVTDDDPDFPSVTAATEDDGALLSASVVGRDLSGLGDTAISALALMVD